MTKKDKQLLLGKSDLRVAFLSTYPPRHCGIATFTRPLERVMNELYLSRRPEIIAINDASYRYDKQVTFTIDDNKRSSFKKAALDVNKSPIEVVNVQHEYGLYGGEAGEYLLDFYENLKKPIVTTLHSVLTKHSPKRAWITQKILNSSQAVIVMTELAKQMLLEVFPVNKDKVEVIPHGAPNIRPNQQNQVKQRLGLEDKFVLMTFGLINPGKGIEFGIKAIADVVKQYPNVIYLVIGATHPVWRREHGEGYRRMLETLVKQYKVAHHIKFINRYLDYSVLVDYLKATDIYLMLQGDPHQAFSGSAAYAIACGKPIIGTPTPFNQEILADGRGEFVPFGDDYLVRSKILKLIKDENLRRTMALRAYRYGRTMIWPRVALDYLKVFDLAVLANSHESSQTNRVS